ncbi:hypothetical protein pb186bvf_005437 [Paramecium bursaria]
MKNIYYSIRKIIFFSQIIQGIKENLYDSKQKIYDKDQFIQMPICTHEFCLNCFRQNFQQLIDTNQINLDSFKCFECSKSHNPSFIIAQAKLDQNRINKFCDQLIQKNIIYNTQQQEIFVECYNTSCNNKFFINSNAENQECNICKKVYCRKCKLEFHLALSCQEAQERQQKAIKLSQESLILNNMGISKCPKCTTRIEKLKGCNFITCPSSVCKNKSHYCYKCLVPLNIQDECKHFENNDPYKGACRVLVNGKWIDKAEAEKLQKQAQKQLQDKPQPQIPLQKINQFHGLIIQPAQQQPKVPNNRIRIISQHNAIRCPHCQSNDPQMTQIMEHNLIYCKSNQCKNSYICYKCKEIMDPQSLQDHFNGVGQCKKFQ